MKVSWLILTMNRRDKVRKSVAHNWANCGQKPDEVIWVDNGSTDGTLDVAKSFDPNVLVQHRENMGVAKGYNRAMALATGSHLVITGCDMLMPDNWLTTFKMAFEFAPNTAVACMYSRPIEECGERARTLDGLQSKSWESFRVGGSGLVISPAMPMDRRMFTRQTVQGAGYLHEGFGLYGWEDVEWALRVERYCRRKDLVNYVIRDHVPTHLGTEGCDEFKPGGDPKEYHAFKRAEVVDPKKQELLVELAKQSHPYFNPYC